MVDENRGRWGTPRRWKSLFIVLGVGAFFAALFLVRPEGGMRHAPAAAVPLDLTPPATVPERHAAGAKAFQENCGQCHGTWAQGTGQGPPLVHRIYEPAHHADIAFQRAVLFGVQAHHWPFGDMPPVPGVDRETVAAIVPFVRWWQGRNGIL